VIIPSRNTAIVEEIANTRNATEPIAGTTKQKKTAITADAINNPNVIGIETNA
jgi:hypothetical protein